MKFVYINIAVFLLIHIIKLFFFLGNMPAYSVVQWLAVPADYLQLLHRPWTIFTYMFVHEHIWHILFNMLVLYFAGILFTDYLGHRRFSVTYILGGLAGALLYMLAFNLFPVFDSVRAVSIAIGASASVMAVLIAIATYLPEYRVHLFLFGPVKLKYIALVYIIIDILSIGGSNSGGHIAHLGGALYGFLYIRSMQSGTDIALVLSRYFDKLNQLFTHKPRMKTVYKSKESKTAHARQRDEQERIDAILDKISRSGYDSLSKEEKETLFKASNQ